MSNFESIFRAMEHIEDEIDLPMSRFPEVLFSDKSDDEILQEPDIVESLEAVVMEWERHILKVIESLENKVQVILIYRESWNKA